MINKKAQTGFEDIFYVLAYLFTAALIIFIVYFVYGEIKTPVTDSLTSAIPDADATFNVSSMMNNPTGGLSLLNNLFPFLLLGLIMATIVSAFFIGSHPVFFFVSLVLLGIVIMLGAIYSNIYQQITTDASFNNISASLHTTNLFMKYLPYEIALIVIIVMFVLYARSGGSQTGL